MVVSCCVGMEWNVACAIDGESTLYFVLWTLDVTKQTKNKKQQKPILLIFN